MLSKEEINHIASLARVGLEDEKEVEMYQKDLSAILDYFNQLNELDTEKTEPIAHITGMENVYRSDVNRDYGSVGKEQILKNAPEEKDGHIKVKSVL